MVEIGFWGAIMFTILISCVIAGFLCDDAEEMDVMDNARYEFDPRTGIIRKV